jgi:hypothetical protein
LYPSGVQRIAGPRDVAPSAIPCQRVEGIVNPRRLLLVLAALIASIAFLAGTASAQQADVIRGRVIGPDSQPIAEVLVTVTSFSGNVSRSARTNRDGRFTVTFPGGDGDYMVAFAAIGYAARRFEIKRLADEEILVADAKLTKVDAVLGAVNVTAPRDKVARNDPSPDISGTERPIPTTDVPANLMGDLAAMAATLPGVQTVPGEGGDPNGFSVLGLGADQNNTTLNGMNFGGSGLPRDAAVSSSLVTTPYDVSRGGFSGAQFSLRTRPGSNFITRGMSLNLDGPGMQWTDAAARALGQEYANVSLGGAVSGPITFDKAFYNVSYQLGRRSNDYSNLMETDPVGLQAAGVAYDSVARLLDILGSASVPASVGGISSNRLSDQGNIFGSVDLAPPSSTRGSAYNLSFNGGWNRNRPAFGSTTSLPASDGERTSWRGGLQGRHTTYFGVGILSETSFGASYNENESEPYLTLPGGRVRVSSVFDDGTNGVQMLSFGGSQALNSSSTTTGAQALNQLSWFSSNNKHRLKLTSELRYDGVSQDQSNNLLGTFTYNSLADLQAGRPASFTRQLTRRTRDAGQLVAGFSLGDSWRKSSSFQLQYGVRVDANRFLDEPALNSQLETALGVRNDRAPNGVYVSPRVGFSWSYGQAAAIAGFQGAARGPRAVVRGGVGLFQNTPSVNQIGNALDNTGLASGVQQLTCIGAATPIPDWTAYAANPSTIPDRCADGTTGTVFSDAAPNVTLFAKNYSAPKSIRSNLQWDGPILGNRFAANIDATYSLNLNQGSFVDLNFNPLSRFTLADEGGRPVFVQPGSIVPATGVIASRDARVSTLFSRVTEQRSDLRSESRQISFRLSPAQFSTKLSWSASYVYSNVRERVRGFTSTVGNPFDVEWARAAFDSRHQIVYSVGYNFWDAVRVSWFGQFRSGQPFTPVIAGDVNGDGFSNDRAFIFDPSGSSDPALAGAMNQLLRSGSSAARECLAKQIGQLARRNSCQGPWTSNASLSISFNPSKIRMPQRASIQFQLSNPLAAADMLLHDDDKLKGWGQFAIPDPSLLYVRGFDPGTQRYRYEVNQRFGATNPQFSAFRAPVTLTAMLRFDVGPTREKQMLTQQLNRGRTLPGQKLPEAMMRAMYAQGGGIANPLATILRQQDTLKLTAKQADSIAALNRWYSIRNDSIWTPVAKYLGALPDRYDEGAAYDRYIQARHATVDLLAKIGPEVKELLTAEQRRKLPAFIASYLEPRYLASIRSGTATFVGGMFPTMSGPVTIGDGRVFIGGGGGGQVMIRQ